MTLMTKYVIMFCHVDSGCGNQFVDAFDFGLEQSLLLDSLEDAVKERAKIIDRCIEDFKEDKDNEYIIDKEVGIIHGVTNDIDVNVYWRGDLVAQTIYRIGEVFWNESSTTIK